MIYALLLIFNYCVPFCETNIVEQHKPEERSFVHGIVILKDWLDEIDNFFECPGHQKKLIENY